MQEPQHPEMLKVDSISATRPPGTRSVEPPEDIQEDDMWESSTLDDLPESDHSS